MTKVFLSKYHSFNPQTVQDILISPYSNGSFVRGENGTVLYHDGRFWIVIKKGDVVSGRYEYEKESDAIDCWWKYESKY